MRLWLVGLLAAAVSLSAYSESSKVAVFSYPSSPEFLVLELSSRVNWAPYGVGPFVRIYGDGRVHTHRPRGMKSSGDSEAWLSAPDLDELIQRLADAGLMEFDQQAVEAEFLAVKKRRRAEGRAAPMIVDGGTAVLAIQLSSYKSPGGGKAVGNYSQTFSWSALDFAASEYPEVEGLQPLYRANKALRTLGELVQDAAARGHKMTRLPETGFRAESRLNL